MLSRQIIIFIKQSPAKLFLTSNRSCSHLYPSNNENEISNDNHKKKKNVFLLKKWKIENEIADDNNEKNKKTRQLKKWRNLPEYKNDGILAKLVGERKPGAKITLLDPTLNMKTYKLWYKEIQRDYLKWDQRFILERHQILGNNLAVAHFVLHRGGKIRQKGVDEFLTRKDISNIPMSYAPNWLVEEIDCSNCDICYEGLDNFKDLRNLRRVSFKGCKYIDDWCLEKLICLCPNIEYLDVTECKNVTERGIQGVYRSWNLKYLLVTDYDHKATFELTCLMLEDCMPGLKVDIIKIPKISGGAQ